MANGAGEGMKLEISKTCKLSKYPDAFGIVFQSSQQRQGSDDESGFEVNFQFAECTYPSTKAKFAYSMYRGKKKLALYCWDVSEGGIPNGVLG